MRFRRGQTGFLAILGAVPVVILTILIIVQVVGSIDNVFVDMFNSTTQSEANTTAEAVFSNSWNGIAMIPIVVIILFASVVLGAIGLLGIRG
jgi:hypothetical protein